MVKPMSTKQLVASVKRLPEEQQKEIINKAADALCQLFPKQDNPPVYSIGFQRWSKLSVKKKFACYQKLGRKDAQGGLDIWGEATQAILDELQTKTVAEFLNS